MAEREQVKIISNDPEGYCLKYRENLEPGDRKYYPPPEPSPEPEPKRKKVKNYDSISKL